MIHQEIKKEMKDFQVKSAPQTRTPVISDGVNKLNVWKVNSGQNY